MPSRRPVECAHDGNRYIAAGAADGCILACGRLCHGRRHTGSARAEQPIGGVNAIPELAPQWKKLDLAEILSRPAAFVSISQVKSLYEPWGVQGAEGHRNRGSLPATIKAVQAARAARNFKSFSWIGYEVFRQGYPQSDFDRVQYEFLDRHLGLADREAKGRQ